MKMDQVVRAAVREHFPFFLRKVFAELCPGDEFLHGWHLDAIAWQLDRISNGEIQRLIVTIPPRHLKSIMISIAWVAWCLGKAPEMRFICLSYSSELAAKLSRDCRQVMQSDWYQAVFPGTVLLRSTETELETHEGGGRFATSVGGTLTGRGGDVIIIDDPIKADDAMSAALRARVKEWTTSTLFSRLNDKRSGAIILVMQRLHEDDLAGQFLDAGGWEHLNLPAIALEDQDIPLTGGRGHRRLAGEVLHPEREPLETLEQIRLEVGSHIFSAQYQQAPVPAGGTLVKSDWFRRYETPPKKGPGDFIVQSWDTASKDGVLNDYSVCITALVRRDTVAVLDVFRRQLNFPDLLRQVQMQAEWFSPDILLIEDAASGQQLIQMLKQNPIRGVPMPIARKPEADKETRMSACCPQIERGDLSLPDDADWLAEFEREILAFPNGKRDDQADALSQLLAWVRDRPKILSVKAWISHDEDGFEYE
jgi:predicted phage terminase large subunit-like protein